MNKEIPKNLTNFIWYFLKPYKTATFLFLILAALAGLWGPISSILVKHLIDVLPSAAKGDMYSLFFPASLFVLNFIILDNVTWRGIGYITFKYQQKIENSIKREVLNHILDYSHQHFQDNLSGKISSNIIMLATNTGQLLFNLAHNFVRGFTPLSSTFVVSYFVSPKFFYVMAIWFIFFATFSISMSSRFIKLSDVHAAKESLVSGQFVDSLVNNNNIRLFNGKIFELVRMEKYFRASNKAFKNMMFFSLVLNIVQGLLISIMMGFSLYFLVELYKRQLVTTGDFVLILWLTTDLGHMMWFTMSQVDTFNQSRGSCKQCLDSVLNNPDIIEDINNTELKVPSGKIAFEKVKFLYKGSRPLFEDKSFLINAGEKVGLVGYSGSGKTTLTNLILRLYDLSSGRILIDDQDIKYVSGRSLRNNITLIP